MVPTIKLTGPAALGVTDNRVFRAFSAALLPTTVKLGRVEPPEWKKAKVAKAAHYFRGRIPLPDAVDYTPKAMASIGRVYANDQLGCCVISDCYHSVGVWSGNDDDTPGCVTVNDSEVVQTYNRLKAGPGDSGCIIVDVLDAWKNQGIPVNGVVNRLDAYAALDPTDQYSYQLGVYEFGRVRIGVNLPGDWTQNDTWDITNSQIVGGHDIPVVRWDRDYAYVSSWGRIYRITWRALLSGRYCTEAYIEVNPYWYGANKKTVTGVDVQRLIADNNAFPNVDPGPVVPPTPPVPPTPTPTPTGEFAIALSGQFPTLFGSKTVPITGRATPIMAGWPTVRVDYVNLSPARSIDPWKTFADAMKLYHDLAALDLLSGSADVTQAIAALVSAVRSRDIWAAALAAQSLVAALRDKLTPEAVATITADVRAILSDLGV